MRESDMRRREVYRLATASANAVVAALAFSQLGCSLLFLTKAPNPGTPLSNDRDAPICTERSALPVWDSVAAGVGAGLVVGSLFNTATPPQDYNPSREKRIFDGVLLGTAAVVGVVSGISAGWGFRETGKCRKYLHPPKTEEPAASKPAPARRLEEVRPPDGSRPVASPGP
jgi:hypothetical protein